MRPLLLAPLLLLPLLLGGCAEPQDPSKDVPGPESPAADVASAAPGTASATAGATATSASRPSAGPTPSSGGSAPSRGGSTPAPTGPCKAAAIATTLHTTDSGAGSIDYTFAFTNRGRVFCTLTGAPNVYMIGRDGSQLGRAADGNDVRGPVVRVPPGESAYATARVVNVGTDGGPLGDRCTPAPGIGFDLDVPGLAGLAQVRTAVHGCTEYDLPFITVTAVRKGDY